jgi:hypothetical protein
VALGNLAAAIRQYHECQHCLTILGNDPTKESREIEKS